MDLLPYASYAPPNRRRQAALVTLLVGSLAIGSVLTLQRYPRATPAQSTTPALPAPPIVKTEAPPPPPEPPRERPLKDWLVEIAADAELGLVVGPELDRRATAVFPEDASWESRLDALAAVGEFHYVVRDRVIEVRTGGETATEGAAPVAAAPPVLPPDALVPREPDAPPPSTVVSVRAEHARAVDLAKALDRALADEGVSAAADAHSNAVLLSGPKDAVEAATDLVRGLDVPRRRFLVEANIVEMLTAARSDLGVQWRIESEHLGAAANFPIDALDGREGEVTIATGGTVSLKARMSALEADGRARVVARPRVLVIEGTPALIESVRILRIRLPDSTSVVADGGDDDEIVGGNSGKAVEEFPVGISLKVEPSLLGGGKIALRVTAKSSTLGEPLPPDDIPEELSRLVESDFFVADGETAVLGGLARVARSRSGSGLPLLRDLPLVGLLFGRRARERDTEELVVLVTPYLLD